jgi:hypothetical protein
MRRQLFVIVCGLVLVGLVWWVFPQEKKLARKDIVKFSHEFHIDTIGAGCTDCHTTVEESQSAADNLLPTMDTCGGCHDVEDDQSCTQCHYEDEETWVAFENPPRDLLFSHQLHVEKLEQNCQACHRGVEKVEYASKANLPVMTDCTQCHDDRQAPLECTNCHVSTLNLRPVSHSPDFLVTHKRTARIDRIECATCHVETDCQQCHESDVLTGVPAGGGKRLDVTFRPSRSGTRSLAIQRVHELNFRFTHPLKASGRVQECSVCHEQRTFCTDCHASEGVDVAGKPLWHGGPDWGAIAGAVGTGGGRHAELARRDIERCTSCHDVEGQDPTCMLCHRDDDGVKGTDPKTHSSDFSRRFGEEAAFHDDEGAVCFACHTDTKQAGVGFCGYCHGPEEE